MRRPLPPAITTMNILRGFLWVLMGGLFIQGIGSLIFRLVPALPPHMPLLVRGTFGIDFWHGLIHIVWGVAGLMLVIINKARRTLARFAMVFGVFYTGLAIWGVLVHHPLGLELDLPENVFHWVAGPTSLFIGIWGYSHSKTREASLDEEPAG